MSSKRTSEPWMPADEFGRSLKGAGFNLIVTDVARSAAFARDVLGAKILYEDQDFAAIEGSGATWMLHAPHTYDDHPLSGIFKGTDTPGAGIELRLYEVNPDRAEKAARENDHIVLQGSMDKPHGLRECFILDPDGYCWVPSRRLPA